jgi:hypothetical protein
VGACSVTVFNLAQLGTRTAEQEAGLGSQDDSSFSRDVLTADDLDLVEERVDGEGGNPDED